MRFIFVRHGKTHFNEINLTQGWCDSPLSKVGIRQVESISKQLEQYQIDKAYTSPLGRAVQTSNIILSKKKSNRFMKYVLKKLILEYLKEYPQNL